jgi:hypothetical protein
LVIVPEEHREKVKKPRKYMEKRILKRGLPKNVGRRK